MAAPQTTATPAFNAAYAGSGHLKHTASSFVCPYPDCGVYARHMWGTMSNVGVYVGSSSHAGRTVKGAELYVALCTACGRDTIFLDGKMVKPEASEAPPASADIPTEIQSEYAEAAAIVGSSPRGAAALLRLAVQKLLPLLGATKRDINEQIGELVGKGLIPNRVSSALDTLRVIGNEAVHPGTIDLKDDVEIAMGLFRLLNFIIEKAITEPKHADAMFAMLPQGKRDAIEQRDQKARAAHADNGQNPA